MFQNVGAIVVPSSQLRLPFFPFSLVQIAEHASKDQLTATLQLQVCLFFLKTHPKSEIDALKSLNIITKHVVLYLD